MKYIKLFIIMMLFTTVTLCEDIFNYNLVREKMVYSKYTQDVMPVHTDIRIRREGDEILFSYVERKLDGMLVESIHQKLAYGNTLDDLVMCLTIEDIINKTGTISYDEINTMIEKHWQSSVDRNTKMLTDYVNSVILKYKK